MAKFAKSIAEAEKILKNLKENFDSLGKKEIDEVIKRLLDGNAKLSKWNEQISTFSIQADEASDSLDGVVKSLSDAVNELSKTNTALSQAKKTMRSIQRTAEDALSVRQGESSINEKSLKAAQGRLETQKRTLIAASKAEGVSKAQRKEIEASLDSLDKYKNGIDEILKTHEKTNLQLGIVPGVLGGIDKQLSKLGFPELGIADAVDKTQKLNQAAGGTNGILKTWGTFSLELVKNLTKSLSLTNLLQGTMAMSFSLMTDIDKETTEFAANMGVTNKEAKATKLEMQKLAEEMGGGVIRSDILMKSQIAIGKEIGTNAKLNQKDLVTMNKLVNGGKLRMESAAKLQKLSLLTGKSLDKSSKEILGASKAQQMKNGLVLNEMDILEDVANISDSLALTLGDNPKRLAEAATTAREFGISLAEAGSMADSLLNFENSITAELEAELLTGKQLNFEKARGLALAGENDKAAAEMLKQVKSVAEYNKMDMIAKKALAKSMGMEEQALAKSLRQREALNKMGAKEGQSMQERYNELVKEGKSHAEIAAMVGGEEQRQMLEKQGIQDKFNDSMFQLKEILATQLTPILIEVQKFLDKYPGAITKTLKVVGLLGAAFVGIKTTLGAINVLKQAGNALSFISNTSASELLAKLFGQETVLAAMITQETFMNTLKSSGNVLTAARAAMEESVLGRMVLQGLNIVKNIGKSVLLNVQSAANAAANAAIVVSQNAQLGGFGKLIARGAAYLATLLAQAAAAMAANAAVTFGIGVAIAVAAAAAGFAAVKAMTGNDIMSPGKNKPGYGERTLFGPEGAIQLNDKDTVIAGTNLFGNDTVSEPGKPTEMKGKGELKVKSEGADMSAVIEAINSLAGRPISVQIDGREIAVATEDGNPRAMGENRSANSFQIN